MKIDYHKMAAYIVDNMLEMFPAAQRKFQSEAKRGAYTRSLSVALHERSYSKKAAKRALYWAREHDNSFMPSVGQVLTWCKTPLPVEHEQPDYKEGNNAKKKTFRSNMSEKELQSHKQRINNLLKELNN